MIPDFVSLDFGHTLAREVPSRVAIYTEDGRRHGLDVDEDTMRQVMDQVHEDLSPPPAGMTRYSESWFELYVSRVFHGEFGMSQAAARAVRDSLFPRFTDAGTYGLFPGAHELCLDLKSAGIKLGLISNWSPALYEVLEGLQLARLMDVILISAVEGLEKPDPDLFKRALDRAQVPAGRSLHAGNEPDLDCAGARSAGMATILVDHGKVHADQSTWPRVASLSELREQILGM